MKTHTEEIVIFYNPGVNKHKKTVAHAKSLAEAVRTYSFDKMPQAENIWATIWEGLGEEKAGEIFDPKNEKYDSLVGGASLGFESWMKIASHNPDLIVDPIGVRGKTVVLCQRQTDIHRLMDKHVTTPRDPMVGLKKDKEFD